MLQMNKYEEAIPLFSRLVELNPTHDLWRQQLQELHKYQERTAASKGNGSGASVRSTNSTNSGQSK